MDRAAFRRVLWNAGESRPRTPWRLLGQTFLLVVLFLVLAIVFRPVAAFARTWGLFVEVAPLAVMAADLVAFAAVTLASILLAVRYLDRRTLADLGLGGGRDWWTDLGIGLALGGGLVSAIFLTKLVGGWIEVEAGGAGGQPGTTLAGALLVGAVMMVAVGVWEEVLFRGYYLVNLAEGMRGLPWMDPRRATLFAALLTSLGFGLVHSFNPGATVAHGLLVAIYGGYLAAAYLLTGNLALPIGFHVAWNYAQSFVFGFPVSGLDLALGLVQTEPTGPRVLTGGSFGPEGGLVALVWLLLSIPLLVWWSRRRNRPAPQMVAEPQLRDRDG